MAAASPSRPHPRKRRSPRPTRVGARGDGRRAHRSVHLTPRVCAWRVCVRVSARSTRPEHAWPASRAAVVWGGHATRALRGARAWGAAILSRACVDAEAGCGHLTNGHGAPGGGGRERATDEHGGAHAHTCSCGPRSNWELPWRCARVRDLSRGLEFGMCWWGMSSALDEFLIS